MVAWLVDAVAGWLAALRVSGPGALAPQDATKRDERFDPSRCPLEDFN